MSQSPLTSSGENHELELIEFFIEEAHGENAHDENAHDEEAHNVAPHNGTLRDEAPAYRGYYGMNVSKVLEIIRRPTITAVPGNHHPAALGTFNLRGRVLPLVDLARWLGKSMVESESNKVIVCEFYGITIAFLCSGVTRIHRLQWASVEPPDCYVRAYSNDSITGIVRLEERILFILDMEKIVTSMGGSVNFMTNEQLLFDPEGVAQANVAGDNPENTNNDGTPSFATKLDPEVIKRNGNYHVLIADDSSSIRNLIGGKLTQDGFRVTSTSSGRQAWQELEAIKQQAIDQNVPVTSLLHLIISDIEMPEMDGHTLTKQVKSDSVLQQLPVVLFSSLITEAMRAKGLSVGADDQISKPDLPGLTRRVQSMILEKIGE